MAETAKRIDCYYTTIPNKVGAAAKVLNALKEESTNLISFNGFTTGLGRAQLHFVASDPVAFLAAASKAEIKLVGPKVDFLIQGEDRVGSVADILSKLGQAQINVIDMQAIASSEGHYGCILSVEPKDIDKTAQALGVLTA
jgi:hypothetical protein